ncbi:PREDICTED: uncharacterized protein LOC108368885 isoform X1 [Rhagoletis zephyria]|uniref:uncharacterized protein LOC108368885 isoform X1 n=1 Tax=Rhagoletis zephyria TaxID=28612 RepID=UPI0008119BD1|nr:PREDICTED: uncharacterized protein LOC108368885 isoform X1 [Rhagoletis zephyria]
MSSGEWDLRALKALEEEEQKEFLALSQKSLFDPPSPPTGERLFQQTQLLKQQQFQPKLTYAQLHPHILNLPTINECNLVAAARKRQQLLQQQNTADSRTGGRRLKFTRALSISAHSLTGVGSQEIRKKVESQKSKANVSKVSNASSPAQSYSPSPIYTPPPIRRCATLHHTQPVRKAFKTLQQLEKQKEDRKKEAAATLKRLVGTNKTYWKYGANSTAASIIVQRKKLNSSIAEIESNTSDEFGSEETTNNFSGNDSHANPDRWLKSYVDCDDSATDTGSCTVPLTSDSVEMMRLMLSAATAAVKTHPINTQTPAATAENKPKDVDYLLNKRPLNIATSVNVAATSGGSCKDFSNPSTTSTPLCATKAKQLNGGNNVVQSDYGSTFLTLSSRYPLKLSASLFTPEEKTVAYRAFNEQQRRKSLSHNGVRLAPLPLQRGRSLTDEISANDCSNNSNSHSLTITGQNVRSANTRNMLKSSSLDMCTNMNESLNAKSGNCAIQRSSLIANSIVEGMKTASSLSIKELDVLADSTKKLRQQHSILNVHTTRHAEPHVTPILCRGRVSSNNGSNCNGPSIAATIAATDQGTPLDSLHQHIIDDDLEQHIKHCACSCNHMGYGNSMDYQATGFGGLPDVTEHSNAHRTLSRQNSISNSDSGGEIASIEKSKVNFGDGRPLPTAHPANIKRKSKATHQAASDSCARVHRLKPRRGSCTIFLTLVAALCLFTIAAMLAYQHFVAPSRNSHAQRLKIVQRILKEVPLVDGHNNFAWNVRKYAHNSLELVHMRRDPSAEALWTRPSWAQTDIERLKQGLVGVQMWSAYVPCEALGLDAVQVAIEQIDIIRRLTDMFTGDTILVSSSKDIFTARQHGQMASLIGIKGGHAIGSSLAVLRSFYSVGARSLSLTHKCDLSWAGSSASESESGLSAFGKAVIREMNRLGMMVDLSHSSDATARDVLQVTRAPVIFSHSAARQLCNSTRNVPDDILRLVADNGGLIMVSFDPEDVACGQQAYLGDVVEHIKHIRAIAGVQHIGLGAGYDGIEVPPVGLEDVSKYPDLLATLLQDHNWSEQDIAMLAGKNFLRILETVENVRDYWKRADIQPLEQTEPQPKPQCTYMSS